MTHPGLSTKCPCPCGSGLTGKRTPLTGSAAWKITCQRCYPTTVAKSARALVDQSTEQDRRNAQARRRLEELREEREYASR